MNVQVIEQLVDWPSVLLVETLCYSIDLQDCSMMPLGFTQTNHCTLCSAYLPFGDMGVKPIGIGINLDWR